MMDTKGFTPAQLAEYFRAMAEAVGDLPDGAEGADPDLIREIERTTREQVLGRPLMTARDFHKGQRVERLKDGTTGTVVMLGNMAVAVTMDDTGKTLPFKPESIRPLVGDR